MFYENKLFVGGDIGVVFYLYLINLILFNYLLISYISNILIFDEFNELIGLITTLSLTSSLFYNCYI